MVRLSRIVVCVWGVILTVSGLILWSIYTKNKDSDLIGLAFGMVAYTYGPLLGVLMGALLPVKVSGKGLMVGTILSVLLVAWFRPELMIILESIGLEGVAQTLISWRPKLASEWFFPINAGLTLIAGILGGYFMNSKKEGQ